MKSALGSASAAVNMRGLTVFISDIRQCQSKEAEKRRVDKELAHIRQKFLGQGSLSSYQRKKYVWKMLYIHMLGYELDFGHMEAINLVSAEKYSEKSVGYLACTLLLHEEHELLALLINSMRKDIISGNENFQTLALSCICNIGSAEFAEALAPDVMRLLTPGSPSRSNKHAVKKRACLCLLRLYRKVPEIITVEEFGDTMMMLLDERNMGVLTAAMGLFNGLVARNSEGYEAAVPKICRLLTRYVVQQEYPPEYTYYQLPSPWLQVKLLRALQYFPPPDDRQLNDVLYKVLQRILTGTERHKNVNKNNAVHAIFFEAVRLVIHLGRGSMLLNTACTMLGKFITMQDSNLRYLGMETMALMAEKNDVTDQLAKHRSHILGALFKENDISMRKRCLDLLYNICDDESAELVVGELLKFLEQCDFLIKEEVVLKIAVLAERHALDTEWYVDVVLQLISLAGDFVAEDVWWRVVQIITNNEGVQLYAARKVLVEMEPTNAHETIVRVGCHVLGEYADLLVKEGTTSPQKVLELFQGKFATASPSTRAMILTVYGKLTNVFPDIAPQARALFEQHAPSLDAELQQRSCEYMALASAQNLQRTVFEVMPTFPERESSVIRLVKKKMKGEVTDVNENGEEVRREAPERERERERERGDSDRNSRRDDDDVPIGSRHDDDDDNALGAMAARQRAAESSLLDLGEPAESKPASGGGAVSDLDALFGVASPQAPVLPGASHHSNAQQLEAHRTTVMTMMTSAVVDGVLYEDDVVQVGIKIQFQNQQGRMAIYFGNKTQSSLANFQSTIEAFPPIQFQSKPPPNIVGGMQQVQHLVLLECVSAFVDSPPLSVQFSLDGQAISLPLTLPISCSSFIVPNQRTGQQFFGSWNALAGDGKDRQLVFGVKDDECLQKPRMEQAVKNLRLSSLSGVDPNAANVVGAGELKLRGDPGFVLVRVESNLRDKLLRASVRATSKELAESVERLLRFQLAAN